MFFRESSLEVILKLILFTTGIIFTITNQFGGIVELVCSVDNLHSYSEPTSILAYFICIICFILVFSWEILGALFRSTLLGKQYLPGLLFQLCFLACFIYIGVGGEAHLVYNAIIMTGFINLFLSLSDSTLCGKYIFIALGVLKTLLRVAVPVLLLLFSLAATEFVLRYQEVVFEQLKGWL